MAHRYIQQLKSELAGGGKPRSGTPCTVNRAFVAAASLADLYEVSAASFALSQPRPDEIRSLAFDLLQDRRQNAQRLQSTLKFVPETEGDACIAYQLDGRRESILLHLKHIEPAGFGVAFIRQAVQSHEEAIDVFRSYETLGSDVPLLAFARITVEKLEHRLVRVQEMS